MADYAFRTLEDRKKIEKLWEDGRTPKEISETTGVPKAGEQHPALHRPSQESAVPNEYL